MEKNYTFQWSDSFKKMYGKKEGLIQEKVRRTLEKLAKGNPYKLGKKKTGLDYGFDPRGIKVDKSNRIVYDIVENPENSKIRLLKVCDHKEVGFKD